MLQFFIIKIYLDLIVTVNVGQVKHICAYEKLHRKRVAFSAAYQSIFGVNCSVSQSAGQVISDGGNGRSESYFPKGPDPSCFIQLHCLGSGSLRVQVPDPLHSLNVNTLNWMSAGTMAQVVCKIWKEKCAWRVRH